MWIWAIDGTLIIDTTEWGVIFHPAHVTGQDQNLKMIMKHILSSILAAWLIFNNQVNVLR